MKGTFLFLGTGASAGVPVIGCKCPVCQSDSPKNKRFRPSGIVHIDGKFLLIDIGPDFRSQALRFGVETIDGLLMTHTHFDHIAGIDDLRIFNVREKKSIPCLLSEESLIEIQKRYHYFFNQKEGTAKLDFFPLEGRMGWVDFLGIQIGFCTYTQGGMMVNGFRVGDFAYISDIQKYDESLFESLKGTRTLVLSALMPDRSPFHLSFEEAIHFSNRVGADKTWITHLSHSHDHEELNRLLPPHIRIAYDGLKLEFSCTK